MIIGKSLALYSGKVWKHFGKVWEQRDEEYIKGKGVGYGITDYLYSR